MAGHGCSEGGLLMRRDPSVPHACHAPIPHPFSPHPKHGVGEGVSAYEERSPSVPL